MEQFFEPYPEKPSYLEHSDKNACVASRVAMIGTNGAGKTTTIDSLVGELKSAEGVIWRHQNMRLAYMAQYACHHLEKHRDKTVVGHSLCLFAGDNDREFLVYDEDEKLRLVPPVRP